MSRCVDTSDMKPQLICFVSTVIEPWIICAPVASAITLLCCAIVSLSFGTHFGSALLGQRRGHSAQTAARPITAISAAPTWPAVVALRRKASHSRGGANRNAKDARVAIVGGFGGGTGWARDWHRNRNRNHVMPGGRPAFVRNPTHLSPNKC